ncbi:MAG: copper homeostasis protein CutC [Planctomycetota bacterium]
MNPPKVLLEVCVGSAAGVLAAAAGGADRAELCADLVEGGITPSAGEIELAVERAPIPVMAMVRPRGGDFLYTDLEYDIMVRDVQAARDRGAAGVVFGVLDAEGAIDRERTARLAEAARPLQVTFHRAFDMAQDPNAALETLAELGIDRVLTSGQEAGAPAGLPLLRRLVEQAGDRVIVMPGAGIDASNIRAVAAETGARELHFAALADIESPMRFRNPRPAMGAGPAPGEFERQVTDPELVRRAVAALGEQT